MGRPPPSHPQVAEEIQSLLGVVRSEMKRAEIQAALGLKDRKHFQHAYLRPARGAVLIKMTIPDKPLSSWQRYRLTPEGRARLESAEEDGK